MTTLSCQGHLTDSGVLKINFEISIEIYFQVFGKLNALETHLKVHTGLVVVIKKINRCLLKKKKSKEIKTPRD